MLIKHWVNLMQRGDEQLRRVVLLEVEARLRQFAAEAPASPEKRAGSSEVMLLQGQAQQFGRIVALVAERCREPISVSKNCGGAGATPKIPDGDVSPTKRNDPA